jgi:hypothetical protein
MSSRREKGVVDLTDPLLYGGLYEPGLARRQLHWRRLQQESTAFAPSLLFAGESDPALSIISTISRRSRPSLTIFDLARNRRHVRSSGLYNVFMFGYSTLLQDRCKNHITSASKNVSFSPMSTCRQPAHADRCSTSTHLASELCQLCMFVKSRVYAQ